MKTEWTFTDRSKWVEGPWDSEPIDKKVWTDPNTGLECMIHRGVGGSWCGYVGVPSGHTLHGRDYEAILGEVCVHGGLTFSDSCQGMDDDGYGVCHPSDDGDHVWWFGFDCAHLGDLVPAMPSIYGKSKYRTQEYVEKEVTDLASQIGA